MRQIICTDKGCIMEAMDYSQSGGGQESIDFMAGEQDGLTPSEGNYMIPLPKPAQAHSPVKPQARKKRRQVVVGGGRKKVKRANRNQRRRRHPLRRLKQVGFGRRQTKKGRRKCVKGRR